MMKLSKCACIEPLYSELPFLQRFEAAKKDGFDYVEFWSWTDKDLDAVKKAADDCGIKISGFNGDADYSLIDPSHKKNYLDFLKKSVDAAIKIGALSVTIHSNALGDGGKVVNHYTGLSHTVKLCSMYDTLLECAKIAGRSGIAMNLEALNIITDHAGNFLIHTGDAAEMTRLIGSPKLKILYDVYHMQLNEGNICGNINAFIDQIGHVHVADAPGRHEPGTGEINYHQVFARLEKAGYTGRVGYELFPKTSTAEAVRAIMAY
jgi:hydroxypyruvate isomerase